MSFLDDIQSGREQFRKKSIMRTRNHTHRVKPNSVFMELGRVLEFLSSTIRRKKTDACTDSEVHPVRKRPYLKIVQNDINSFFQWICGYLPKIKKEKERYDPLSAAWERGRRGG
jgi:hypothetical protein